MAACSVSARLDQQVARLNETAELCAAPTGGALHTAGIKRSVYARQIVAFDFFCLYPNAAVVFIFLCALYASLVQQHTASARTQLRSHYSTADCACSRRARSVHTRSGGVLALLLNGLFCVERVFQTTIWRVAPLRTPSLATFGKLIS